MSGSLASIPTDTLVDTMVFKLSAALNALVGAGDLTKIFDGALTISVDPDPMNMDKVHWRAQASFNGYTIKAAYTTTTLTAQHMGGGSVQPSFFQGLATQLLRDLMEQMAKKANEGGLDWKFPVFGEDIPTYTQAMAHLTEQAIEAVKLPADLIGSIVGDPVGKPPMVMLVPTSPKVKPEVIANIQEFMDKFGGHPAGVGDKAVFFEKPEHGAPPFQFLTDENGQFMPPSKNDDAVDGAMSTVQSLSDTVMGTPAGQSLSDTVMAMMGKAVAKDLDDVINKGDSDLKINDEGEPEMISTTLEKMVNADWSVWKAAQFAHNAGPQGIEGDFQQYPQEVQALWIRTMFMEALRFGLSELGIDPAVKLHSCSVLIKPPLPIFKLDYLVTYPVTQQSFHLYGEFKDKIAVEVGRLAYMAAWAVKYNLAPDEQIEKP